jgi:hypothetical protein
VTWCASVGVPSTAAVEALLVSAIEPDLNGLMLEAGEDNSAAVPLTRPFSFING